MSVSSHIYNNGGLTRQLATQSMSFRETAHSGTDPDALSEILSTPNSPIKVVAEANMPIAYRCNFVSVGEEVTVADCTYEGTILIRREAINDRMIVFLPMEGNAFFDGMREQIYSVPARGTILEAGRAAGAACLGLAVISACSSIRQRSSATSRRCSNERSAAISIFILTSI